MAYDFRLAEEEKQELLRIARATLKEYLISGRVPPGAPHRKCLLAAAGAFVSLHAGDRLRGCIGTLAESQPLYKAIQEMAVAAASRDPRFEPVTSEELALLKIEVSVFGERYQILGPAEVEVGKHGLCISAAGRRGLLLPQVATEHGWGPEAFLERTCEKAGLPRDAWRLPDAFIEVFTAQVFAEKAAAPKVTPPATAAG